MKKSYFLKEIKRCMKSKVVILTMIAYFLMIIFPCIGQMDGGINRLRKKVEYISMFHYSLYDSIIYICLPILVSIPYAMRYSLERDCGMTNIIFTKVSRKKYYLSKYITNIVSSALIIFIPAFIWYFCLISMTGTNFKGKIMFIELNFFRELFEASPFTYGLFMIINSTICAIVLSTLCLGFSVIIKNKIVAFLSPMIIYIFSGVVLALYDIRLDLTRMYSLWNRGTTSVWYLLLLEIIVFAIGSIMYFGGIRWKYCYDE